MNAKQRTIPALLISCCLWSAHCNAQTVPFNFSGITSNLFGQPIELTLAGGFQLDPNSSANLSTSPDGLFHGGVFTSSLNQIWGTFGDWTFSGNFAVYVSDGPVWLSPGNDWSGQDSWIIRSTLTGPSVNGWTPLNLNLFYYTSPGGINNVNVFPPQDPLLNSSGDPYSLQFTLNFIDDTGVQQFTGGPLFEIQSVPEPSSFAVFVVAVLLLAGHRVANKRSSHGV